MDTTIKLGCFLKKHLGKIKIFIPQNLSLAKILRDSFYYSGAAFTRLTPIILVPLYTRHLLASEYGILEYALSLIGLLSILFSFGLHQMIGVYYYKYEANRAQVIADILTIYTFSIAPICILASLPMISKSISNLLLNGDNYIFFLTIWTTFLFFYHTLFYSIIRLDLRSATYFFLSLAASISILLSNFYLVGFLHLGVRAILTTHLLTFVPPFAFFLKHFARNRYQFENLKIRLRLKYLKTSTPLVAKGLCMWIVNLSDRWFIMHMHGEQELGIYSLAYRLSSVFPSFIIFLVSSVYSPRIYRVFSSTHMDKANSINNRFLAIYSVCLCGFTIAYWYILRLLFPYLIGESFGAALQLTPLIMGGYIFLGLSYVSSYPLIYREKTKVIMYIYIVASIINAFLNYPLILHYQAYGAAFSTLVTYLSMFLMMFGLKALVWKTDKAKLKS